MNQINSSSTLVVGQQVYSILYGGRYGTIVAISGEQHAGRQPREFGGVIVIGGTCTIDVVFDDGSMSQALPEAILRGVQWRIYDEVISPEAVAGWVATAATYRAQQAAKADAEKIAKAQADERARADGMAMGLIPEAEFRAAGKRGSAAAHNLRAELKKAGIKASVKQDGYTCLRVQIGDNAQKEAAKAIMSKYKAGRFDGMTDCYEYSSSAWGRVFGDVQYVFGISVEGYTF